MPTGSIYGRVFSVFVAASILFVRLVMRLAHTYHINLDSAMSSIFIDPMAWWRLRLLFRTAPFLRPLTSRRLTVGFMEEQVRHIFL